MTPATEVPPRPVPSRTFGPTLTRRTLLHLLGAPFLSHAAAETPEPADVHVRLWRHLDDALRRRDQAIVNRDRLEATLVRQLGYPRVQLPTATGTPLRFAADAFTIDRILGPGRHRLRQRFKAHLQRRRLAWHQAAHVACLPQALAAEDAAFQAVEQATVALLDTPATTLVAIRLKLVVVLAKHAPGAADQNEAPWADLRRLLVDLDRVLVW